MQTMFPQVINRTLRVSAFAPLPSSVKFFLPQAKVSRKGAKAQRSQITEEYSNHKGHKVHEEFQCTAILLFVPFVLFVFSSIP